MGSRKTFIITVENLKELILYVVKTKNLDVDKNDIASLLYEIEPLIVKKYKNFAPLLRFLGQCIGLAGMYHHRHSIQKLLEALDRIQVIEEHQEKEWDSI